MPLSKEFLEILACPVCKGELRLLDGGEGLACDHCRIKYPIRDEIPVMLADEAEKLD